MLLFTDLILLYFCLCDQLDSLLPSAAGKAEPEVTYLTVYFFDFSFLALYVAPISRRTQTTPQITQSGINHAESWVMYFAQLDLLGSTVAKHSSRQ